MMGWCTYLCNLPVGLSLHLGTMLTYLVLCPLLLLAGAVPTESPEKYISLLMSYHNR
jgi:hypothetical protein